MRVYSSPPQVNNTEYGLRLGTEMMTYLEDFFGVGYPMPKLGNETNYNHSSLNFHRSLLLIYVLVVFGHGRPFNELISMRASNCCPDDKKDHCSEYSNRQKLNEVAYHHKK